MGWSPVGGPAQQTNVKRAAEAILGRDMGCQAYVERAGKIVTASRRFCDFVGRARESVLASTLYQLTHPSDVAESRDRIECLMTGAIPHYALEKRYQRGDGSSAWVLETGSLAAPQQDRPVCAIVTIEDISSRKTAESAAREREARLTAILETVPDAMVIIGEGGGIEAFSTTAERLFGYTFDEVRGSNVKVLMPSPYRDEHDTYLERYKKTGERRIIGTGRIVVGQRRDRSTFPMQLTVGEARWGDKRFFVGFVRDLTERRNAEVHAQQLHTELAHLSRYTALGEMAATLAHELNQPLTAIVGFLKGSSRILDRQGGNAAELRDALGEAANEALRAGEIIRRLREFVVRRNSEHLVENLQNLIEEACALALIGARERGVQVSFHFDRRAASVLADRIQIQQVLVNLLRNAVEAMDRSSRRELTLTTRLCDDDDHAEVAVLDTGPGISPEIADRLFQPFVTTKQSGMGVGLSISRTIIEAHDGRLWVEANPQGGSVFRFTLPVVTKRDLEHAQ